MPPYFSTLLKNSSHPSQNPGFTPGDQQDPALNFHSGFDIIISQVQNMGGVFYLPKMY